MLANRDILDDIEKKSRESDGLFERRAGRLAEIDPVFGAARDKQIAEGGLAQFREDNFAEAELLLDQVKADTKLALEKEGATFASAIADPIFGIFDLFGQERAAIDFLAGDREGSVVLDEERQSRI